MTTIPWSQNKNARQIYREYVEFWGFTYEGDTSDGHHVFRYPPTGAEVTLAHSPSAGWAWVKARRAEAAKITGKPFRGKRDTHAAKARAAVEREKATVQRVRWQRASADKRAEVEQILATAQATRQARANVDTIRQIRSGLRNLTTPAQRRYAEAAIATLVEENRELLAG